MLRNDVLILGLMNLPKLGKSTVYKMVTNARMEGIYDVRDVQQILRHYRFDFSTDEIEQSFIKAEETLKDQEYFHDIKAVTVLDKNFPRRLRNIPSPAPILFYKGNLNTILDEKLIAIVGTREPSVHGQMVAQKISMIFTELGFGIVSGLASGVDTLAHTGCLRQGGKTIAVMGTSLDKIYPSENKRLARNILENDGCWISEYAVGTQTNKSAFVDRDRIQSALSAAVLVIETDIEGGTMHTAEAAKKQQKPIFCYRPSSEFLSNPKVQGNLKLLNERTALSFSGSQDLEFILKVINDYLFEERFSRNIRLTEQIKLF